MAKIDNLLKYAASMGASDLHLVAGTTPLMRVHGELRPIKTNPISPKDSLALVAEILTPAQKDHFTKNLDIDLSYEAPGLGRFRGNVLKQRKGVDAVFRIISNEIPTLDKLGFPQVVKDLTHHHQGMVLVTGPAGCGKSTTLAAMIDYINSARKLHIITVEDPIEYVHPNKMANVTQREVKLHTENFASALRASLREDPDVILIGEMRDLETVQMAITAAETGHLVLGTLHTRNAAKTVDRIIDVFPPSQQNQIRAMLSESLRGVVSQQLIPRADGNGRVLAYEVLVGGLAIANLIRDGKTFQIPSLMQIGVKEGMILMDQCLAKLLAAKTITYEQALSRAENKKIIPKQ
ncbi:MAG: type IV pili twitching motility protein PilT [Acidobacteria bacterium]|nr:MAG: type IV pili twitching motility protein PilT [Acidobacteriota bacterium]